MQKKEIKKIESQTANNFFKAAKQNQRSQQHLLSKTSTSGFKSSEKPRYLQEMALEKPEKTELTEQEDNYNLDIMFNEPQEYIFQIVQFMKLAAKKQKKTGRSSRNGLTSNNSSRLSRQSSVSRFGNRQKSVKKSSNKSEAQEPVDNKFSYILELETTHGNKIVKYFIEEGLEFPIWLNIPQVVVKIWRCDAENQALSLIDDDTILINQKRILEYNVENEVSIGLKVFF